ncbi:MAG: glutamate--tRNA ligase, partial [Clostridia bacterium]|nr:glutamate--tRNA ligase [Clostridia bacterium]
LRDMHITHVIRAEEHLSNTPKQILVYRALGHPVPFFAHVPMILAPDRSKLSKRHGALGLEELRAAGYFPEAIVNYLALLGWSPGDEREILDLGEMVRLFSLERVNKTAAIYDIEKLTWLNGHYLRKADLDRLVNEALPRLQAAGLLSAVHSPEEMERLRAIIALGRERARTLAELPDLLAYFFQRPTEYDPVGVRKHFKPGIDRTLDRLADLVASVEPFTATAIESAYRALAAEMGLKAAELIHPTRLAVTGRTVGPGLFDVLALVGREECVARLRQAADYVRHLAVV